MKWLKRLVLLLVVLVAVLAVVPFFVSVDDYRPQIEQMLADKIKEPVRLKSLRLAGLPLPHVVVDGVEIGKADVKVGKIAITPDLWSLLTANKIIRSVKITGLVINQRALDRIPLWTRTDPKAKPADFTVSVQTVQLDDALLQLQNASFGPFDARVTIAASGAPERADITARDGKFKATVTPVGEKFNIDVQAKGWRLPAGPPILFDELLVRGIATLNDANLGEVRARLYGGTVAGKTSMAWKKGLQLQGDYTVSDVELRDLVPLFSPKTRVSGRLTARPVFSASAASAGNIADALKLNTPFNVRDGVLQGIDIQKAATNLIQKDSSGETRFDTLSGNFAMDRGNQRITHLKVVSGVLAADGNVTIAPNKNLSGRINAQVRAGTMTAATVPLNVSGTLDSPLLLPTGASMAGAAVGTAILGPGVGTSVGAKVGTWAESLFGGDKKK
ncbi:MAG: AsmA family protein [Burkholderiales bacterium]|nr:AsmA family protein [Burkholderiales bacterium]